MMDFTAVNTKIRAMRSHLFSAGEYESLCQLGSVENIGNRLRELPGYLESLSVLDVNALHRNVLEQRIVLSLSHDLARIMPYIYDGQIKDYLTAVFLSNELNTLKLLLCMVYDERNITYTPAELALLMGHETGVDLQKLVTSKTVEEFIEHLSGSHIYRSLADAYQEDHTLFALERQLDLYYYLNLWKKQEKLTDVYNRGIIKHIKGTEIDLRNILWLYRMKRYYNMHDTRVYAYLIPINYRLRAADFKIMAESEQMDMFLESLANTPYADVFGDFSKPEQGFIRAMRNVYNEAAQKQPDSLAVVVRYVFDKEQEINNVTSILEGVRYGLSVPEIMEYVSI